MAKKTVSKRGKRKIVIHRIDPAQLTRVIGGSSTFQPAEPTIPLPSLPPPGVFPIQPKVPR
jgi:hypothetical protein